MRRGAWIVFALAGAILVVGSVAVATHETGHTVTSGTEVREVVTAAHTFETYPQNQAFTVPVSSQWVNVPGATVAVVVPRGERGLVIARFSPNISLGSSGSVSARILIGGVPGNPDDTTTMVGSFDTGTLYTERSAGPFGPGKVTVRAQILPGSDFRMFNYHLTVERVAVP